MIENQESVTAKLCSFARAYHSSFEHDRIFDDGLAFDMMGLDEFESMGLLIQHGFKFLRENSYYGFDRSAVVPVLTRCIMPIPISRIAFAEKELTAFIEKKSGVPIRDLRSGHGFLFVQKHASERPRF